MFLWKKTQFINNDAWLYNKKLELVARPCDGIPKGWCDRRTLLMLLHHSKPMVIGEEAGEGIDIFCEFLIVWIQLCNEKNKQLLS